MKFLTHFEVMDDDLRQLASIGRSKMSPLDWNSSINEQEALPQYQQKMSAYLCTVSPKSMAPATLIPDPSSATMIFPSLKSP